MILGTLEFSSDNTGGGAVHIFSQFLCVQSQIGERILNLSEDVCHLQVPRNFLV